MCHQQPRRQGHDAVFKSIPEADSPCDVRGNNQQPLITLQTVTREEGTPHVNRIQLGSCHPTSITETTSENAPRLEAWTNPQPRQKTLQSPQGARKAGLNDRGRGRVGRTLASSQVNPTVQITGREASRDNGTTGGRRGRISNAAILVGRGGRPRGVTHWSRPEIRPISTSPPALRQRKPHQLSKICNGCGGLHEGHDDMGACQLWEQCYIHSPGKSPVYQRARQGQGPRSIASARGPESPPIGGRQ